MGAKLSHIFAPITESKKNKDFLKMQAATYFLQKNQRTVSFSEHIRVVTDAICRYLPGGTCEIVYGTKICRDTDLARHLGKFRKCNLHTCVHINLWGNAPTVDVWTHEIQFRQMRLQYFPQCC